jgi:hypothetical protein
MKPEVLPAFLALTEKHEGRCAFFYLDVKGLVTIGLGNLAEPIQRVLHLDFVHHHDGSSAAWSDIVAAWQTVHARQDLRTHGGGAFANLTSIRMTDASIDKLVLGTLAAFESVLHGTFPEWDSWPYQAQLATLSMAWASGPHLNVGWPHFVAACRAQDWATAAVECTPSAAEMAAQNASFHERVAEQQRLFREAAGHVLPPLVAKALSLLGQAADDSGDADEEATDALPATAVYTDPWKRK